MISGKNLKKNFVGFFPIFVAITLIFMGCNGGGDSSGSGDGSGAGTSNVVACNLNDVDQCFEWVNLSNLMVNSLSSTCVNDDNGTIIDACPSENLIGICEEIDDSPQPDLLNYFYMDPLHADPDEFKLQKEQACIDAGGNWVPVN